jgi:hypothetical protein
MTQSKSEIQELQELYTIPILENELIWIARVISEESTKELPDTDTNETSQ